MHEFIFKVDTSVKSEKELLNNLIDFNKEHCPFLREQKPQTKKFGIYVYDGEKRIAGIHGYKDKNMWLYIGLLYVDPEYRGKELGAKLMHQAEQFARKNKCFGIRLETWSFQALGFYLKLGYHIFGKLKDFPPGYTEFHLKKLL